MRIFLLIFLVLALPARAHEFWVAPKSYTVAPGDPIIADLRVGQDFEGLAQSYFPKRFARFDVTIGNNTVPVEGRLGDIPAQSQVFPGEGLAVIVHETKDDSLRYRERALFESFVAHKDLGPILAEHAARGLPELEFREAYTRYAKALVALGGGQGTDVRTGLHIEIVALKNPYTDDLSAGLPVQVFYQDAVRAASQVEVFARALDGTVSSRLYRTDAQGVAVIDVAAGVEYLVDSVVMEDTGNDDPAAGPVWHSAWASLTFRVPGG